MQVLSKNASVLYNITDRNYYQGWIGKIKIESQRVMEILHADVEWGFHSSDKSKVCRNVNVLVAFVIVYSVYYILNYCLKRKGTHVCVHFYLVSLNSDVIPDKPWTMFSEWLINGWRKCSATVIRKYELKPQCVVPAQWSGKLQFKWLNDYFWNYWRMEAFFSLLGKCSLGNNSTLSSSEYMHSKRPITPLNSGRWHLWPQG